MPFDSSLRKSMRRRLERLYPGRANECLEIIGAVCRKHEPFLPQHLRTLDQSEVVLITYPDQIRGEGEQPLRSLRRFLKEFRLQRLVRALHLLPFYPFSSDDGFSVIDYRQVDPCFGTWRDVRDLSQDFDLVFDLVLNHASSQSAWFRNYLQGCEPYASYFLEADPAQDHSEVTRPRTTQLLTSFSTSRGPRHLWTTFGADQVDLDYAQPDVLIEMIDILLSYVRRGARIIRLDAVAYLWKRAGTPCIHLTETHEIVKLFRDLIEALAPGVLLLTETNVPHAENVSYFGQGDEANLIYNFSLPPLLLDAFVNRDASHLKQWLRGLSEPPRGAYFFNITASHDGIGVRPLEGLLPPQRLDRLIDSAQARGGRVARKRNRDGSESAYELNCTWFDALCGDLTDPALQARRFLSSQAVMLALKGIPGIYFHSLLGTPNDSEAMRASGIPRRINRRRFQLDELRRLLGESGSPHSMIFEGLQRFLKVRVQRPAFHPESAQEIWELGNDRVLALVRRPPGAGDPILSLVNLGQGHEIIDLGRRFAAGRDLISGCSFPGGPIPLEPFQCRWILIQRN